MECHITRDNPITYMADILFVERVVCQRIDIRILHTYVHYLMSKAEREVATHAEVTRL